jgi:L-iditol 2-dehydrogenase
MKAAFLTAPKTIELRDVPAPVMPEDGLMIDVKACGICGSDVRRWKEGPPPGTNGVIPGHEAAGVVVEVGKECKDFAVGDRMAIAPDIHCSRCYYCLREMYNLCDNLRFVGITPGYPGGFAEKMVLTREILTDGIVHRMPDGLSFEHAAVSEPCCSVLTTHDKARTKVGDTVVVIGAGPAGCLHVSVAKNRGARVIVSEAQKARREMVERFKPDLILDPAAADPVAKIKEFTNGIGADIVVCANPVADTQTRAVEMVRKAGKVILFGGLPKADPMTTVNGNLIHYGEIEVVGAFSYHPSMHKVALDLLAQGKLPAESLITHTFGLDNIAEAYEAAASGETLKVIIQIGKN